jgi:hypothetical protein
MCNLTRFNGNGDHASKLDLVLDEKRAKESSSVKARAASSTSASVRRAHSTSKSQVTGSRKLVGNTTTEFDTGNSMSVVAVVVSLQTRNQASEARKHAAKSHKGLPSKGYFQQHHFLLGDTIVFSRNIVHPSLV